jgi:hypothetical protein
MPAMIWAEALVPPIWSQPARRELPGLKSCEKL